MRLSRTVSSRSSESSWGTRPSLALIRGPSVEGSIPSTRSVPPETGDMHEIIRIVLVLPAPLGPRNPKHSPRTISKSTPSTAVKSPNRLQRPRATTRAGDTAAGDTAAGDTAAGDTAAGDTAAGDGPVPSVRARAGSVHPSVRSVPP